MTNKRMGAEMTTAESDRGYRSLDRNEKNIDGEWPGRNSSASHCPQLIMSKRKLVVTNYGVVVHFVKMRFPCCGHHRSVIYSIVAVAVGTQSNGQNSALKRAEDSKKSFPSIKKFVKKLEKFDP